MAQDIETPDPDKGQNPSAVQSVTEGASHPADKTSAPVELPTDVNRPPVSTNKPDVPIAHSNVSGDMGPTGEPEYKPELGPDQGEAEEPPAPRRGRPPKEESE